jgi:hypothetical protein
MKEFLKKKFVVDSVKRFGNIQIQDISLQSHIKVFTDTIKNGKELANT